MTGLIEEGIMNGKECKKLVESYHEATNRGDLDALDKIFAKDFINEAAGFDPV
jgi:ketosteroid isomerase-like protein